MSVSTTVSRVIYNGNGAAISFPTTFPVLSSSNLVVTKVGSDGSETSLSQGSGTTNYSVSGSFPGIATITYPASGGENILTSSEKIVIQRVVPLEQNTDLVNQGAWDPDQVESALDYLMFAIQQASDESNRSFKASVGTDTSIDFTVPAPQAGRVVGGVWNDDATAVVAGPTASDITSAQESATSAAASASEADDSATNSASSAAAAAAAAASVTSVWKIVRVSFADSPISIGVSDNGTQYVVDTSGGNVSFTLPLIATVGEPASFAISKSTGDTNKITVNRSGTDLIDGGISGETQYDQESVGVVQYFADEDTTPDRWAVNTSIVATGNMVDEVFDDGVDYTAGVTTELTLSKNYGSEANIIVWFDGIAQHPDEYSLSGTTLTFSSPITSGVSEVFIRGGTTLSIGVPADRAVTSDKLADGSAGAIFSYDSSGRPVEIPAGTAGQVLTSNGAGSEASFQSSVSVNRYDLNSLYFSNAHAGGSCNRVGQNFGFIDTIDSRYKMITDASLMSNMTYINISNASPNGNLINSATTDSIPIQDGNRTSIITVTQGAGSNFSGTLSNVVDGQITSGTSDSIRFSSSTNPENFSLIFDLGSKYVINGSIRINRDFSNTLTCKFQASVDGSTNWVDITDETLINSGSGLALASITKITYARYVKFLITSSDTVGTSDWIREVEFFSDFNLSGSALTGVLVSDVVSADSEPSSISLTAVFSEFGYISSPGGSSTDITLMASRDGGTTWTAAASQSFTDRLCFSELSGDVDVSAQPSGTDVRWKIVTGTDRVIDIKNIALYWS